MNYRDTYRFGDVVLREFWNERYCNELYAYGEEPNTFFKWYIDSHPPGIVLLPGEGEGRNAVYAAMNHWEVHAIDFSSEGKRKALALAEKNNVKIDYRVSDINNSELDENTYDLIALIYLHIHERERIHRSIIPCLKMNGIVLLEGFSKEQINNDTGGPRDPSRLFSLEDLQSNFTDLEIEYARQEEIQLNAGLYHQGKGSVIRLLAKKRDSF